MWKAEEGRWEIKEKRNEGRSGERWREEGERGQLLCT